MALDPAPMAQLAAEFMDDMEQEWGEGTELGAFMLTAEILTNDGWSTVETRCPAGNVAAIGLTARAAVAILTDD